jgi:diguanylate cyclase (GGDEF)-like protein/PAS domain S-box-containing protein
MSQGSDVCAGQPPEAAALQQRLREVERSLAETERLAGLGTWSWDIAADVVCWSDELYRLCGLSPHEFEATFEAYLARVEPDDRDVVLQNVGAVLDGSADAYEFDHRIVRPDGRVRWLRGRGQVARDEQGSPVRLFGTSQDITASREAEQQLREQRELAVLAGVMQATDDAVIVFSPDGTIQHWNPGAERLYGYAAEEAVGQHLSLIMSEEQTARLPAVMAELDARGHVRTDSAAVRKDGTQLHTSVTLSQIRPLGGHVTALVGIARDVTEQKRGEEREREHARQLTRLAFHDPLTGLANRALLHDRLSRALARRGQHRTEVLLLDLDDFKSVNDVSGHAAGDQLLVEVARRLLTRVRAEDTVARLGGDEFAILLQDSDSHVVAERVQQALCEPVSIGNREVVPRASIGIGGNDDGAQDPDQLILRADVAMYAAKADGKGRIKTFSPDMADAIRERADLEAALRQAVARGEIVVHYQPIVDVTAGVVSRFEALVRWQRGHGLVPPWQFLALAESSGVIKQIGAEVLRQALSTLRSWLGDDPRRSVAVNVSAVQLIDAHFAEDVLHALETTDVRPGQLVLEVTESLFLESEPQLVEQLAALRARGVRVSIDDFGTGYSSLGRLQALPVDSIKIDKSFVDDLQTGHEDLPILTSMIVMAHNLGLDVTAEGVESAIQAERLVALGCGYLQGYHFARPMPADELPPATDAANEVTRALGFSTHSPERGRPEVVLVEDDRATRLLISTSLATHGWRVHEAATAQEGQRLASAAAHVDCILIDVNLPDGDGIDLVAVLRARPHLVSTPIVVLTGTADRQTKARAFTAGADDYIVKPISGPQLAARVRGAMHAESRPQPGWSAPQSPVQEVDLGAGAEA